MKFTFSNLPGLAWHERTGKIVDLARLCEEVGFDRFGVSDWRFMSDCQVTMTACLLGTRTLGVQSQVTDPYVRHPSLTGRGPRHDGRSCARPGDPRLRRRA